MITLSANTCLITAIIETLRELEEKYGDRSILAQPPAVVLPTRRLGTALIAALANCSPNRGIVAPVTLTLEDLIVSGVRHAATSIEAREILRQARWPADRCELLLETLLRQEEYKLLHPGHAHEVAHFFSELEKNGLEANAFGDLQRIVSEDIYRGGETVGMLGNRFAELNELYGKYRSLLASAGATSAQLWQQRAAKFLAKNMQSDQRIGLPWPRLVIAGFTSASPAELELFRTLMEVSEARKHSEVTFVLHESPPIFARTSPLKELTQQLQMSTQTPVAKGKSIGRFTQPRMVVPISSVADEAAYAVQLAADAIAGGISASGIAIVVTAEETYGNILRTLLKTSDIENFNFAVPVSLADTPAGIWLSLFAKILSGEKQGENQKGDAETVLDFIAHPLSLINAGDESRDQSRALMTQILCDERIITTSDLRRYCEKHKLHPVSAAILELFQKVQGFADLYRSRKKLTPARWRESFVQLATAFIKSDSLSDDKTDDKTDGNTGGNEDDSATKTMHDSVLAALDSFSASLEGIEAALPLPMSGDEFLQAVDRYLLGSKVRSVGDPLAGVQILGLTEARHMPFVLTIIVGCVEGKFPRSVPKDSLVDQYLQARVGLPGWRQLESMEDTTFGLLNERLPAIVMTYPQNEGDSPNVRSRFLDRLVNEGSAQVVIPENAKRFISVIQEFGAVDPLDEKSTTTYGLGGLGMNARSISAAAEGIRDTVSASSLTQLINCPYAYALQKMGVRDQSFHRDDDRRAEGEWMHEVLEAFFTGCTGDKSESKRIAPDLPDKIAPEGFDEWALARLKSITETLAPSSILKTALWLRLLSHSYPRFIEHVRKIWTRGTEIHPQRGWKELRLRTSPALTDAGHQQIGTAGQPRVFALIRPPIGNDKDGKNEVSSVPASGSIDSVDFCESIVLLTDYKRSGSPTGNEVDRGFAPQIPFYVNALQKASEPQSIADLIPLEKVVAGFWSILDGEFILAGTGSPAAFDEAKRLGFIKTTAKAPRDLGASIVAFTRNWKWRLDEITSTNEFSPDESSCGFCRLSTSCRKGDPHLKAPFKDNRRLDRYRSEMGKQQEK